MEIWRQKGKIVQGSKQYGNSALQLGDRERHVLETRDERYSTLRRERERETERELSTRGHTLHLGTFRTGDEVAEACDQASVQERGKTVATILTDASEYADGGTLKTDALCAASTASTSTALSETAFSDRERPVERHDSNDENESCERRERQSWSCSPPNSRSSSGVLWGEGESEWRADTRDKEREREERLQQEVDEKWAAAHACMRRLHASATHAHCGHGMHTADMAAARVAYA